MSSTWDNKALKATPTGLDEILLIDTADSRNQKRATLTSLGLTPWSRNSGSDGDQVNFRAKIAGNINRVVVSTP